MLIRPSRSRARTKSIADRLLSPDGGEVLGYQWRRADGQSRLARLTAFLAPHRHGVARQRPERRLMSLTTLLQRHFKSARNRACDRLRIVGVDEECMVALDRGARKSRQ